MQLYSIFPNEIAFYEKMGVELFELNKDYERLFVNSQKAAGIDFYNTLFYQNKPQKWDRVSQRIAVLMTSVALYRSWHELFQYTPDRLIGYGIGYISALVCEGAISLRSAIKVIQSHNPQMAQILKLPGNTELLTERGRVDSKQALLKRIESCLNINCAPDTETVMTGTCDADAVIEIGPDNTLSSVIEEKIVSYYDTRRDCNHLLENVKYLKFFNQDYLILRFLGMMVSTRNYNEDRGAADKITGVYGQCKEVADKIRAGGFGNTPMTVIPGDPQTLPPEKQNSRISTLDDYFAALTYMKTVFQLKSLPESEVSYRLHTLESETMIPLKKDYDNVIVTVV